MAVQPIPDGYHTITPYLLVENVEMYVQFLEKAFDATQARLTTMPDGTATHAEIKIGTSMLMLGKSNDDWKPNPSMLYLYVPDTDALYKKAMEAGGTSIMEPADQFYGDRNAAVLDAQGNQWWIATHVKDVTPEELQKREAERYAEQNAL